ncbi:MAG: ribosome biogenesis GTPase Der [Deltaproteobacteria bacterium]|nr:MAG: ribosome biogenesis GTPase Der [Deltaproteobacteria bacterium]
MSLVAIVGRPNVGKSTLFNRLVGRKTAIVEDVPGVTRDRNYADAVIEGHPVTLVDTGGLEPYNEDELAASMAGQAEQAVVEADLILFVTDAHEGILPVDYEVADFLRKRAKDVLLVVNKVDGRNWEASAGEFYSLGFENVLQISAEHKLGISELTEEMGSRLEGATPTEAPEEGATRVAILGRPNVGKSSFVNKILGSDRVVVSPVAGTTRDAVDTRVIVEERPYILIDTAGIRRKSRVEKRGVERWSVLKAMRAIDRAEVCLLMVDGEEGVTDQDLRILDLILRAGRGIAICVNKWDLVEKDGKTFDRMKKDLAVKLGPHRHVPVISISALTGLRVRKVFEIIDSIHGEWQKRISTSKLNDFMEETMRILPPPVVGRKRTRIYYATQVATKPPSFTAFSSYPEGIPVNYERYLVNRLREVFGFEGVPVRFFFRKRKRPGDNSGD